MALGAVIHGDQTKICNQEHGYQALLLLDIARMAAALYFTLDVFLLSEPFDITACLLPMPKET